MTRPKLYFDGIHVGDLENTEIIVGVDPAGGEDKTVLALVRLDSDDDGELEPWVEALGELGREGSS